MNREEFVQNYSKVTALTWANEDYLKRLMKAPREVLAEAGIKTPKDARINVITIEADKTGGGSIDGQVERWERGQETGVYDFVLSLKPKGWEPGNVALSDMDLAAVAGGVGEEQEADISISCCCCTPCTCCT